MSFKKIYDTEEEKEQYLSYQKIIHKPLSNIIEASPVNLNHHRS